MRRIGVPLADMVVALEHLARPGAVVGDGDLDSVHGILADHLARLEEGLADARREVARLAAMLEETPGSASGEWVLDGVAFAEALRAVRFAVGSDPEFPALHGVLVEVDGQECRVVATDRYRLAVSAAPVTASSGRAPARVVVPTAWVDRVLAAAPSPPVGPDLPSGSDAPVRLLVTASTVTLDRGDGAPPSPPTSSRGTIPTTSASSSTSTRARRRRTRAVWRGRCGGRRRGIRERTGSPSSSSACEPAS